MMKMNHVCQSNLCTRVFLFFFVGGGGGGEVDFCLKYMVSHICVRCQKLFCLYLLIVHCDIALL